MKTIIGALIIILLSAVTTCCGSDTEDNDADDGINNDTNTTNKTDTDADTNVDTDTSTIKDDNDTDKPTGIIWVPISGGSFVMGNEMSGDAKPEHNVTLPAFEMMKTEVTVTQYEQCVTAGECAIPATNNPGCNWDTEGYEDHPVNCVDWAQSFAFCAWLGGRLPSESEWEYAASNGSLDSSHPWGDGAATCEYAIMDDMKHSAGCDTNRTWAVCSKPLGSTNDKLCDMSGNVWEWVQDWYHDSYTGAPNDGSAWEDSGTARVNRGGGFSDGAYAMNNYVRYSDTPEIQLKILGLRCAREAQ